MSVLIETEPPLSGEEIVVKHVSLAEALYVIKDDNYSSTSSVKPRPLSRRERLCLSCPVCTNTQSPLWMGRARQLCLVAKGGFCGPSPMDSLTQKPYPGELGQTLLSWSSSVLPCCRIRPGSRDTEATGSMFQTVGRRASWFQGLRLFLLEATSLPAHRVPSPAFTKEPEQ